jgi:hypothetical protein
MQGDPPSDRRGYAATLARKLGQGGTRRGLRPKPMARSLAFEGEAAGVDEVGFGSAAPAGVAGVDWVDLCRSQFELDDVAGLGDTARPDGLRDRASNDGCGYAG